jgi:hypothetical protein
LLKLELISLIDAVPQPPDGGTRHLGHFGAEEGGSGGSQLGSLPISRDLPEKSTCYLSLRKAVNEAAALEFSAEAISAAAEAVVTAHFSPRLAMESSNASALEALFEGMRSSLGLSKKAVDNARGFAELDSICEGAPWASAVDVFSRLCGIFRSTARPP